MVELKNITGVEIMQTGTHNGDKYTIADLNDIANSFSELKTTLQPYVKLGHNEDQKMLSGDGLPAAGWIENVYVSGEKLLADIVDMPKKIYDLIKNRAYKRVSSEIYWNFKSHGGTIYRRALKAIALLGGDTPAVGSLADVQALYSKREFQYQDDCESHVYDVDVAQFSNDPNKEENDMPDKDKLKPSDDLTGLLAEQKKTAEELYTLKEQLKAEQDRAKLIEKEKAELSKNFSTLTAELRKKEIEGKVEDLVNSKKILPAQRGGCALIFKLQDKIKVYDDTQEDVVSKFFEQSPELLDEKEYTTNEGRKTDDEKEKAVAQSIEKETDYTKARNLYVSRSQEGDN